MDYETSGLNEVKVEQVQGVGNGSFAFVGRIVDTPFAVKVPSSGAGDHYAVEKKIYERLGHHPFILRYYRETKVVSTAWTKTGLLLHYHPIGTLAAMLTDPQLALKYAHQRTK